MKKRDSFIFYRSFYEAINDLDNETQLQIYQAIARYSLNFEESEFNGISKAIFTLIKPQLEANNKRYSNGTKPKQSKTEAKHKQTASKARANKNVNVNENKNVNTNVVKSDGFKKPTINDIEIRCKDMRYFLDAEKFFNYYESNGWKVGRNKMKSWHSALANWNKNDTTKPQQQSFKQQDEQRAKEKSDNISRLLNNGFNPFNQDDWDKLSSYESQLMQEHQQGAIDVQLTN